MRNSHVIYASVNNYGGKICYENHQFYLSSTPVKVLNIDAPGNLVNMFEEMSKIDPSLPQEKKDEALAVIRKQKYDNHFIKVKKEEL